MNKIQIRIFFGPDGTKHVQPFHLSLGFIITLLNENYTVRYI